MIGRFIATTAIVVTLIAISTVMIVVCGFVIDVINHLEGSEPWRS